MEVRDRQVTASEAFNISHLLKNEFVYLRKIIYRVAQYSKPYLKLLTRLFFFITVESRELKDSISWYYIFYMRDLICDVVSYCF